MAVATGARLAEGHARSTRGFALAASWRCDESIESLQAALRIAQELQEPEHIGRGFVNLTEALYRCGLLEEALAAASAGIAASAEVGTSSTYGRFIRAEAVQAAYEAGRWSDAWRLLEDRLVYEVTSGQTARYELSRRVGLYVGTGHPDAAGMLDDLEAAVRDTPVESQFHANHWLARCEHALWMGDPTAARAVAKAGLEALEDNEWPWAAIRLVRLGTRAAADLAAIGRARRDAPATADAVGDARGLASRLGPLLAKAPAAGAARRELDAERATIEAEVARAAGTDTAQTWSTVAAGWLATGRSPLVAYAQWRTAEAALAAGDRTAASSALGEAARIAQELGAAPLVQHVRSLAARGRLSLETAASAVPGSAGAVPADPFGLTERERAVLGLVALGRTNRQIGAELFISESTAGVHVSNILGKLGVGSRTEAAAVAVRLGLERSADPVG
jgi:DNA-binding NarL/FixJ family response regulator